MLKMERATEHHHLWPFSLKREHLVLSMRGIRQLHCSRQRRREFIADRMGMSEGQQQHVPTLYLQRGGFSFHRQVATTNTEEVKDAIWTGQKIKAPGTSHLHARIKPPFEFQGLKHIGQDIHETLPSWSSAPQAVMTCTGASPKKRSLFNTMFCQVSDPSFLLGTCSFLGKAARRERKGLSMSAGSLLLFPLTPLFRCTS